MASEVKRGFIRIVSNYARLGFGVLLGIALVPLLLETTGEDGYAVVALFGSTIGLASIFQEIVRSSMIRELGAAYHAPSRDAFTATYNSAIVLALLAACGAAALFAALYACIPLFRVEPVQDGARALVASRGVEAFITIALAPAFNMYLVAERLVAYNFFMLVVKQAAYVGVAVWLVVARPYHTAEEALILFAWWSMAIACGWLIVSVVAIMWIDPALRPRPSKARRSYLAQIARIGGWNAATVTAMNLHFRVDAVIMNLAFGIFGSQVWGYTVQLASAVRRGVTGMTDGLDAVSARLTAHTDNEASNGSRRNAVRSLIHHSTRLHGLIAFPSMALVVALAEPILDVWIGSKLKDPAAVIPTAAILIQIVAIGTTIRGVSDGWLRILYGAGHIRQYAPIILAGGVVNPVLVIGLIFVLPSGTAELAVVGAVYTAIMAVMHGVIAPHRGARVLDIAVSDLYRPLVRPFVCTLLAAPVLMLPLLRGSWSLPYLLAVVAAYGAVYSVLVLVFVAEPADRRIVSNAIHRRFGRRGNRPTAVQ